MKNLTVGVIAVLLMVADLDNMAEGKLSHAKNDHGKSAPENHWSNSPKYDDFLECIKEHGGTEEDVWNFAEADAEHAEQLDSHVLKCVAGCFYDSINLTKNGELNKNKFIKFLGIMGTDVYYGAQIHYADCKASLADVPENDICKRGETVYICLKKGMPITEV